MAEGRVQIRRRGSSDAMPMIRIISKMEAQMAKLAFVNSSCEALDPEKGFERNISRGSTNRHFHCHPIGP